MSRGQARNVSRRLSDRTSPSRSPLPSKLFADAFRDGRSLRFVIMAAVVMAVFYSLYYYPYDANSAPGRLIAGYLAGYARASAALIALVDPAVFVHDNVIAGRFSLKIVKSCAATDIKAMFAAAVLAFGAPLRLRIVGMIVGLVALTALNIARIATLYFVGIHLPGWFDTIHEELFQLTLFAAALGCFAAWLAYVRRNSNGLATITA